MSALPRLFFLVLFLVVSTVSLADSERTIPSEAFASGKPLAVIGPDEKISAEGNSQQNTNLLYTADNNDAIPAERLLNNFLSDTSTDNSQSANDAHEFISPFLPMLNLRYQELHLPVTQNFGIDVYRYYTAKNYGLAFFPKSLENQLLEPGWQIHPGYVIGTELDKHNNPASSEHNSVFVAADGTSRTLINKTNKNNTPLRFEYLTKDSWQGRFVKNHYELISPEGLRYIFANKVRVANRRIDRHDFAQHRYYLSRLEDGKGNSLVYKYQPVFPSNVESIHSNLGQTVKFDYQPIRVRRSDNRHKTGYLPKSILANGKKIVSYGVTRFRRSEYQDLWFVNSARYADGKVWGYDYAGYTIGTTVSQVLLSKVRHPDDSRTYYHYTASDLLEKEVRVVKSSHQRSDGKKADIFFHKHFIANDKGKRIVRRLVRYPDRQVLYSFGTHRPKGRDVWRQGLPLREATYTRGCNQAKCLSQIKLYQWQPASISRQHEEALGWRGHNATDGATYRANMTRKIIDVFGLDSKGKAERYDTLYSHFDLYGHAREVKEVGPKGERLISKTFDHKTVKRNIIHNLKTLSIDGRMILQRDFDGLGQLKFASRFGIDTHFNYDGHGNLAKVTDAAGRTTTYEDYRYGSPQQTHYADGSVTKQKVNINGTIAARTDEAGHTTNYSYNALGQLKTEQKPEGAKITIVRKHQPGFMRVETHRGASLIWQRNNHVGLPRHITTSDISTGEQFDELIGYDEAMRESFHSYPFSMKKDPGKANLGVYTRYDALGRKVEQCSPKPKQNCSRWHYLKNGRLKVIKPDGEYSDFFYTGFGTPGEFLREIAEPDEHVTTIEYSNLGMVKKIKHNGLSHSYDYNDHEQKISETTPETGTSTFSYDKVGNLKSKTSQDGRTLSYDYDSRYRLKAQQAPDRGSILYDYDQRGLLTQVKSDGFTWDYQLSANGNRLQESASFAGQQVVRHFDYNNLDQLTAITYPSGEKLALNPNALGQQKTLGPYANFSYNREARLAQISNGAGHSTRWHYGAKGFVKRQEGQLVDYGYGYDNVLNITAYTDNLKPQDSLTMTYDKLERLKTVNGPWGESAFDYDTQNNLTQQRLGDKALHYHYDDNNLLQSTSGFSPFNLQYDGRGNVEQTTNGLTPVALSYNDDNQLIAANDARYAYDGHGHRYKTEKDGQTRYSLYDEQGLLFYELEADGCRTESFYFQDARLASKNYCDNTSKVTYYHNNLFGNVVAASDETGQLLWRKAYQPFGQLIEDGSTKTTDAQGYSGKRFDAETGLLDFGARVYSPLLGRFLSIDPAEVQGDNPFSFNRYIYANDNPYKYKDPDGRSAVLNDYLGIIDVSSVNQNIAPTSADYYLSNYNNVGFDYKPDVRDFVSYLGDSFKKNIYFGASLSGSIGTGFSESYSRNISGDALYKTETIKGFNLKAGASISGTAYTHGEVSGYYQGAKFCLTGCVNINWSSPANWSMGTSFTVPISVGFNVVSGYKSPRHQNFENKGGL